MFAEDLDVDVKAQQKGGELTDEQGYYHVYSGKVIGNKYKIIEKIGRGVFGVVAKAELVDEPGKYVALKILRKN